VFMQKSPKQKPCVGTVWCKVIPATSLTARPAWSQKISLIKSRLGVLTYDHTAMFQPAAPYSRYQYTTIFSWIHLPIWSSFNDVSQLPNLRRIQVGEYS